MPTLGEALVARLKAHDVEVVFGIPGVHTVELYRGLAASGIRHITPRHEQGAGFMADGYARASGKPGVAFVITGPGLTNTLTAMGQARADSVPMLVVTGVNPTKTLGRGLGCLHELPDQIGLSKTVSITAQTIMNADELVPAIDGVFEAMESERGGPHHIEIPLDVAVYEHAKPSAKVTVPERKEPQADQLEAAMAMLTNAKRAVMLVGGGAKRADAAIGALAEKLDAVVVPTVNARGLMHRHPLCIPASASLEAVRQEIEAADCVLALGTELGPTDYDMFGRGSLPNMQKLIRVDISSEQLARHAADLKIEADAGLVAQALAEKLPNLPIKDAAARAEQVRVAAWAELSDDYRLMCELLNVIRDEIPAALIVGDSTQPVYAGNLYFDHDVAGGWFNASTGFGALGYAIPAAIGAQVASPERNVVVIAGDGGAQFSLPELMTAAQEKLPITFIVWNNGGYGEIELTMERADIDVVGCDPKPPLFEAVAASCGMPYTRVPAEAEALARALRPKHGQTGPRFVEIDAPFIAN
ncbi:5-guanidino-2-oxopentanoate decarboxylase [Lentibacter algarum]|uniref:5-guanidino-2-oxopentanoate decarboxylase n=1 Tax=Lentibacter algarum TaxID=576131 RepID=UPI001C06AA3C|nr:5-guanidino-2-oxopentanoate decarboxylase [Lentibacter algarum]MBU2980505.1 5-guanidino-2-oxopentanoate decarboxylase [Lentibacter algarum]